MLRFLTLQINMVAVEQSSQIIFFISYLQTVKLHSSQT